METWEAVDARLDPAVDTRLWLAMDTRLLPPCPSSFSRRVLSAAIVVVGDAEKQSPSSSPSSSASEYEESEL